MFCQTRYVAAFLAAAGLMAASPAEAQVSAEGRVSFQLFSQRDAGIDVTASRTSTVVWAQTFEQGGLAQISRDIPATGNTYDFRETIPPFGDPLGLDCDTFASFVAELEYDSMQVGQRRADLWKGLLFHRAAISSTINEDDPPMWGRSYLDGVHTETWRFTGGAGKVIARLSVKGKLKAEARDVDVVEDEDADATTRAANGWNVTGNIVAGGVELENLAFQLSNEADNDDDTAPPENPADDIEEEQILINFDKLDGQDVVIQLTVSPGSDPAFVEADIDEAPECFLWLGYDDASVDMGGGDWLLVDPSRSWDVTMEELPHLKIPDNPAFYGRHIYLQTYLWNPDVYPEDPQKTSHGLDVELGVEATAYGPSSGMTLWLNQPPLLGGLLDVGFSID